MGICITNFDVAAGMSACVRVCRNSGIFTTKFKRNDDDNGDYNHKTHVHVQLNYRM